MRLFSRLYLILRCSKHAAGWLPVLLLAHFMALSTPLHADCLNPLASTDLSSGTAWTLSVDGGTPRSIIVPGGGYNSDLQNTPWIDQASVNDHVVYTRQITVPNVSANQASVLEFGAVNYGAEVYVAQADGSNPVLAGTNTGPLNPFSVDITPYVQPGQSYQLQVKAYTLTHYNYHVATGMFYTEAWLYPANGWGSRFGQGITKYVRLSVYPPIAVNNVFVKPSVSNQNFSADVTLTNYTATSGTVTLTGSFSSWNGSPWVYPAVPSQQVVVPARSSVKVTLGPVAWTLGAGSYWWPNRPFSESYVAQLHYLNLAVIQSGQTLHQVSQRFGFVEWTEGNVCYLVNGVRINFLSDGTPESEMSDYDAYSVSPAFLAATGTGTGCTETWKRYMRIGMDANRITQSTPTQAMMDAADEVGFMLIPESAIRGSAGQQVWDATLLPPAVQQLALTCRNHPSVCRYSLENEFNGASLPGGWPYYIGTLIDAMVQIDPTRPLVFENDKLGSPSTYYGINNPGKDANLMMHYSSNPQPATSITGMGECAWDTGSATNNNGLQIYALMAADGRRQNMAYYAGWDWINYWPNFLQGMSAARHCWKQPGNSHPDRTDGVDGWGSPVIQYAQRLFHPFLVLDYAYYHANGTFGTGWPTSQINYQPGQTISRSLDIFNDSLSTRNLNVVWSARWDSATGPLVQSGTLNVSSLAAGYHVTQPVNFTTPSTATSRNLYLVLQSYDADSSQLLFEEDNIQFQIGPPAIGTDPVAYVVPAGCVGAQAWSGGLGMDFAVNRHVVIEQLGVFDSGGDGIAGNDTLTVQLFSISGSNSGQVLAAATFTNASPGTLSGGSRFKALGTPLVLAPGSYSIVAYGFSASNPNGNSSQQTPTWTTNGGGGLISFLGNSRYDSTTPGTLPSISTGVSNEFAAGTFQFRALTPLSGAYNSWIAGWFPQISDANIVGPTANPAGDGQTNLVKYAIGADPTRSMPGEYGLIATSTTSSVGWVFSLPLLGAVPAFSGGAPLTSTYDGLQYVIEGSTDLSSWSLPMAEVTPIPGNGTLSNGYSWRSFQPATSSPSAFFRLRVLSSP